MDLTAYLRVLRLHWIAVVVLVLVGGGTAFGWTLLQPKVYAADASAIITAGTSSDIGTALVGDNLAKSRVKSYLSVGTSRSVADFVITELGLTTSAESLVSRISVDNPKDTAVITVTAKAGTPGAARDLAEAWIRGMTKQIEDIEETPVSQTPTGAGTEGEPAQPTPSIVRLQPLDSAVLPTTPIFPNTLQFVGIGVLLGFVAGFAFALVRNTLDRRIRSAQTLEREFTVPVVGTVPFDKNFTDTDRLIGGSDGGKQNRTKDDWAVAEAMRELRTNLQFMDVDNPPRIIVITSSMPGEGKSTITANLAMTIAANGQNVVVVDGDLRRPTVAKAFGLLPGVGLTDVLVGRAEIEDVLQRWGDTGRLTILGAGSVPPNPSELLGSQAMLAVLSHLSRRAIVLIDAPPLIPVTDAAVLTARTDGALIVARAGSTTIDAMSKALLNLERVNGRPLGLIVNGAPRRGPNSNYYGYNYGGEYASVADNQLDALVGRVTSASEPASQDK